MQRYRMYDPDTGDQPAKACGILIEYADHVEVIVPSERAIGRRQEAPYQEHPRVYHLGNPHYFDLRAMRNDWQKVR